MKQKEIRITAIASFESSYGQQISRKAIRSIIAINFLLARLAQCGKKCNFILCTKRSLVKRRSTNQRENKPCFICYPTTAFIESLNPGIPEGGNDFKATFDARPEMTNRFISHSGPLGG
ncbi:hypothetical protein [Paraburkholderia diazotrophica]|uniref:hypothetical protein n=1 Tax=Paraburkholderia diazotrophica TaxID=667676 RepID=UPI003181E7B5